MFHTEERVKVKRGEHKWGAEGGKKGDTQMIKTRGA